MKDSLIKDSKVSVNNFVQLLQTTKSKFSAVFFPAIVLAITWTWKDFFTLAIQEGMKKLDISQNASEVSSLFITCVILTITGFILAKILGRSLEEKR